MTSPQPPILDRRQKVGIFIEGVTDRVIVRLIGVGILVGGGFLLFNEAKGEKVSTGHLLIHAGIGLVGLLLAFPKQGKVALSTLADTIRPLIPGAAARAAAKELRSTGEAEKPD